MTKLVTNDKLLLVILCAILLCALLFALPSAVVSGVADAADANVTVAIQKDGTAWSGINVLRLKNGSTEIAATSSSDGNYYFTVDGSKSYVVCSTGASDGLKYATLTAGETSVSLAFYSVNASASYGSLIVSSSYTVSLPSIAFEESGVNKIAVLSGTTFNYQITSVSGDALGLYSYEWQGYEGASSNTGSSCSVFVTSATKIEVTISGGSVLATVTVNLDGNKWSGVTVKAKDTVGEAYTEFSETATPGVYSANLNSAHTYSLFVAKDVLYGEDTTLLSDTGISLTLSNFDKSVNCYTVDLSIAATSTNCTDTSVGLYSAAACGESDLLNSSGSTAAYVVFDGASIFGKVTGAGAKGDTGASYTYAWSNSGTAEIQTFTVSADSISESCLVTGIDGKYNVAANVLKTAVGGVETAYTGLTVSAKDASDNSATPMTLVYNSVSKTYKSELYAKTYDVYVGGAATGAQIVVSDGGTNAVTLEYFQLDASATRAGTATSATVGGTLAGGAVLDFSTDVYLLENTTVTLTASGTGAKGTGASYTYLWDDDSSTVATKNVTLTTAAGYDCEVTGVNGTFTLTVTVKRNSVEAWTGHGKTLVLTNSSEQAVSGVVDGANTVYTVGEGSYTLSVDGADFDTVIITDENETIDVVYHLVSWAVSDGAESDTVGSTILATCDGNALSGTSAQVLDGSAVSFVTTGKGLFGTGATYAYAWTVNSSADAETSHELSVASLTEAVTASCTVTGSHGTFTATVSVTLDGEAWDAKDSLISLKKGDETPVSLIATAVGGTASASGISVGVYDIYVGGADSGKNFTVVASSTAEQSSVLSYFTVTFVIDTSRATITAESVTSGNNRVVTAITLVGDMPATPVVTPKTGYTLSSDNSGWNAAPVAANGMATYTAVLAANEISANIPTSFTATYGDTLAVSGTPRFCLSDYAITGDAETGTVSYSILSNNLPVGLIMNTTSGCLTGKIAECMTARVVEFRITGKNGDTLDVSVSFTISKKHVDIVWTLPSSLVFNGSEKSATALITDVNGESHSYAYSTYSAADYSAWDGEGVLDTALLRNAGSYTLVAKVDTTAFNGSSNYVVGNTTCNVTITPFEIVNVNWTLSLNAETLEVEYIYNAAVQTAKATFYFPGTEEYLVPTTVSLAVASYDYDEYTEDAANAQKVDFKNVGTYVLVASLLDAYAEKNNFTVNAEAAERIVSISKNSLTVVWSAKETTTFTYNGSEQSVTASTTPTGGSEIKLSFNVYDSAAYALANGDVSGLETVVFKASGSYVFIAYLPEAYASLADNFVFDAASVKQTLTISKKSVYVSWGETKSQYIYTGEDLSSAVSAFATKVEDAPRGYVTLLVTVYRDNSSATLREVGEYTLKSELSSQDTVYLDNYVFLNTEKSIKIYSKITLSDAVLEGLDDEVVDVLNSYVLGSTLPQPMRSGYTFGGWYTTEDFSGEPVTALTSTEGISLYAKWVEIVEKEPEVPDDRVPVGGDDAALTTGEIVAISVVCSVVFLLGVFAVLLKLKKAGKLGSRKK